MYVHIKNMYVYKYMYIERLRRKERIIMKRKKSRSSVKDWQEAHAFKL